MPLTPIIVFTYQFMISENDMGRWNGYLEDAVIENTVKHAFEVQKIIIISWSVNSFAKRWWIVQLVFTLTFQGLPEPHSAQYYHRPNFLPIEQMQPRCLSIMCHNFLYNSFLRCDFNELLMVYIVIGEFLPPEETFSFMGGFQFPKGE